MQLQSNQECRVPVWSERIKAVRIESKTEPRPEAREFLGGNQPSGGVSWRESTFSGSFLAGIWFWRELFDGISALAGGASRPFLPHHSRSTCVGSSSLIHQGCSKRKPSAPVYPNPPPSYPTSRRPIPWCRPGVCPSPRGFPCRRTNTPLPSDRHLFGCRRMLPPAVVALAPRPPPRPRHMGRRRLHPWSLLRRRCRPLPLAVVGGVVVGWHICPRAEHRGGRGGRRL